MGSAAHVKRGRRLYLTIIASWVVASTLTLSRPAAGAHTLSTTPAEASSQSNEATGSGGNRSESAEPIQEKRGILPPWHENWIPELRHQPGKPARKTTV